MAFISFDPPARGGAANNAEAIEQLYRYLFSMAEKLNVAFSRVNAATGTGSGQTSTGPVNMISNKAIKLAVVSGVKTDYIEVLEDHVTIKTEGIFDVRSGKFQVLTDDFQLSLVRDDGNEVVLDIDPDGGTTMKAVHAGNLREAVFDRIHFTDAEAIGGLRGLADFLKRTDCRDVAYTMSGDEYGEVTLDGYNGALHIYAEGHRIPQLLINEGFAARTCIQDGILTQNAAGKLCVEQHGGALSLRDCWFDQVDAGLYVDGCGELRWNQGDSSLTKVSMDTWLTVKDGGVAYVDGAIPGGSIVNDGGWVTNTSTAGSGGSGTVTPDEPETVTRTVTKYGSLGYYSSKGGFTSGECYQGYTTKQGRLYGCISFDMSDITGTVVSAQLTLTRANNVGRNRAALVNVITSDAVFGSDPTNSNYEIIAQSIGLAAWGESGTLDVTDGAQLLADGAREQIVLYTGEFSTYDDKNYSEHYAKFTSAMLTVTYESQEG